MRGVGATTGQDVLTLAADREALNAARESAEKLAAIWGALASVQDEERQAMLVSRYGADLLKAFNSHKALMEKFGIEGPFKA